jgi:polygalacturonase
MEKFRRDFLRMAGISTLAGGLCALAEKPVHASYSKKAQVRTTPKLTYYDVQSFGAKGDGVTIDSPAINAAITTAASVGGGTVVFPAGVYASYSIRLKSNVALFLQQGCTILAASTPYGGMLSGGYDGAEKQGDWEPYQDFGHNHWHNSLIWGEDLHDVGIFGPGLIWGKGLSRGHRETTLPDTTAPGVGNKAIALKNCRNVILRDFSVLQGGWFAVLATGVDNLTIDNLKIDTNRDGIDIDCCRNVRIDNCSVNSPWDDAICPKSSYALGYARPTENVTISNCFVSGGYQPGTLLDGTWKLFDESERLPRTGRIKCGTESNGGFRNIAIANCVFEHSKGLALETVDGAICEDISITGITMRHVRNSPLFLRLGSRLRGPRAESKVGSLRRVLINNIVSYNGAELPSNFSGIPGHAIEDLSLSNLFLHQVGGAALPAASLHPPEYEDKKPEPDMFGPLPASGLFLRHIKGLSVSHVEVATEQPDARAAFRLEDVVESDFFRVKVSQGSAAAFQIRSSQDFRVFGSKRVRDWAGNVDESRTISAG